VPDPLDVSLAIPVVGGKLLVARRAAGSHLEGAWEFPGGKVRAGETPETAATRELLEETGLGAGDLEPLLVLVHEYPERSVRLHVFLARRPSGEVSRNGPQEWGWMSLRELSQLEMPAANTRILSALRWRLP
jgi:8-oxo-dGTP diphosphatase